MLSNVRANIWTESSIIRSQGSPQSSRLSKIQTYREMISIRAAPYSQDQASLLTHNRDLHLEEGKFLENRSLKGNCYVPVGLVGGHPNLPLALPKQDLSLSLRKYFLKHIQLSHNLDRFLRQMSHNRNWPLNRASTLNRWRCNQERPSILLRSNLSQR